MGAERPYAIGLFLLSFSRVILGAAIIFVFEANDLTAAWIAVTVVIVAQATDNLDGFLTRRFSEPSISGYLQDAVSDKAFHVAALLAITREYELTLLIVWVVMLREIIVLAIRIDTKFSLRQMDELKIYSMLYGVPLRLALLGFFSISISVDFFNLDQGTLVNIFTWLLVTSFIPASVGIYKTLKPR